MSDWYLYMIRVRDGSLYTGITLDVDRRFAEHTAGGRKSAKYFRGKGPLELVFRRKMGSRSQAMRAEAAVKKLPKRKKEKLAKGQVVLDSAFGEAS